MFDYHFLVLGFKQHRTVSFRITACMFATHFNLLLQYVRLCRVRSLLCAQEKQNDDSLRTEREGGMMGKLLREGIIPSAR